MIDHSGLSARPSVGPRRICGPPHGLPIDQDDSVRLFGHTKAQTQAVIRLHVLDKLGAS